MRTPSSLLALELGNDRGRGNLLGIQTFMVSADYTSEYSFHAKLNRYLAVANLRGWLNERTIVVFPEHVGTWLAAAEEPTLVHRVRSMAQAMGIVALHHPLAVSRHLLRATEQDRLAAAIFRTKAERMAQIYQSVFARLAAQYRVTIVAGSLLLPSPRAEQGVLIVGNGPIQNVAAVFAPDGSIQEALARKICPVSSELPFVAAAPLASLPVFDTPPGRLGVLVCADSWYPEPYEQLRAQDVELLAVPSYVAGTGVWTAPWAGYDGARPPADVDPAHVGTLTEAQAWQTYALPGRMETSGARFGINVFLRGDLWDLGGDGGDSLAVGHGAVAVLANEERDGNGAGLLNLWL